MASKNVVIAGGGTGGHIYPGLALAEKLKKEDASYEVHFVGARGGMEETIVPRYGYQLHLFPVDRLHHSVGFFRRLKTLFLLPICFVQAVFLYFYLRPKWVLGVGGFASAPFVFVSAILGGRTAILEPNAFPGMANRYLARFVEFCFLVFQETEKFFPKNKVRTVGLPVRFNSIAEGQPYTGDRKLRLLIFGGSQGARAVNQVVGDWVKNNPQMGEKIEIVHQVGQRDFHIWEKEYAENYNSFLTYQAYIHDMPEKLAWADLVICRAGIGTVAEIAMSRTPAIFIPLPTAADNHQQKNAETLVNRQASFMFLQKEFDHQTLQKKLEDILQNPQQLLTMKKQLAEIDYSQAPAKILQQLNGAAN